MKAIIISVLFLMCMTPLWAQENAEKKVQDETGDIFLPDHRGTCETIPYVDLSIDVSLFKNKISYFEKILADMIDKFSKNQLLSPPRGFDVRFANQIFKWNKLIKPNDFPMEDESKITAGIEIYFSPYYYINDNPVTDFRINSHFRIHVNNPYNIAGTPIMADIYLSPRIVESFYGYPIYITTQSEVTIINYTGKQLFLPVSQEEYIQTMIEYWNSKIDKSQAENQKQLKEIENFYSDAAQQQRKKDLEQAYQELLKFDKKAAEDLRKELGELLEEEFNNAPEVDLYASVPLADQQIEKLNNVLAGMSAAERKRQAYYSVGATEAFNNASGLLPESQKDYGDALVRINPELINDSQNKIQLISIHWGLMQSECHDKPRDLPSSEKPGYITDNKMIELYNDQSFWEDLIQMFGIVPTLKTGE
ncbi:MAG: hypothetical protein PHV35_10425 [Mariniphaga sp.]|nr:hypothetical protein [Mariniphaga sp.]